MAGHNGVDRRAEQDRRQKQLPFLKWLFFNGRRQTSRREDDHKKIVALDFYSPSLFIGIIVVLSLSLLDAMLTLILLSRGATELNPVMDYYLNHGPYTFIAVKYGLTALAVLIVVLLKNALPRRRRFGTATLLHLFAAAFGSVVIWQFYLLSR
jgi:hypothetical protein